MACLLACAQASPGYRVLVAMLSLAGTYAIQMVGGKLLWVSEWGCWLAAYASERAEEMRG